MDVTALYQVLQCLKLFRFLSCTEVLLFSSEIVGIHKYAKCKSVANFIPQYTVDLDNFRFRNILRVCVNNENIKKHKYVLQLIVITVRTFVYTQFHSIAS